MQDIRKMLRLNLEIEGCLRILLDRPNAEAEEIMIDKLSELMQMAKAEAPKAAEPERQPEPAPEPAEPEVHEAPARVEDAVAARQAATFAKAFSINDKYRFIREVFGCSPAAFSSAIDMVGSMSSLDEAYDYFLNELGWDADDEAVSDYLVIVANHFNSAQ